MALMPPLVTVMVKAAENASKSLARDFGEVEQLQVSVKGPSDFVSAADKKAEKTIHYELSKARPDWSFMMEESGAIEGKDKSKVFLVDPLDGTNNFLHGVPHWCITIAAVEDGEVTAGVTFDPVRNEMFWASKGHGAYIRNKRLRISGRRELDMALVACSQAAKGRRDADQLAADLKRVTTQVSGIRSFHSAALDLAYVAAGRFDAYFDRGLKPWDAAAGVLLVREAGGMVTEIDGGKDPINKASILASNAMLYQDVFKLLNQ
jgi:myo-inositol-1(or 4)-monophosphatase